VSQGVCRPISGLSGLDCNSGVNQQSLKPKFCSSSEDELQVVFQTQRVRLLLCMLLSLFTPGIKLPSPELCDEYTRQSIRAPHPMHRTLLPGVLQSCLATRQTWHILVTCDSLLCPVQTGRRSIRWQNTTHWDFQFHICVLPVFNTTPSRYVKLLIRLLLMHSTHYIGAVCYCWLACNSTWHLSSGLVARKFAGLLVGNCTADNH
jgi:hypothetical protein